MKQANLLLYTDESRIVRLVVKRTDATLHCKCNVFVAAGLPEFVRLAKEQSITTGLISVDQNYSRRKP